MIFYEFFPTDREMSRRNVRTERPRDPPVDSLHTRNYLDHQTALGSTEIDDSLNNRRYTLKMLNEARREVDIMGLMLELKEITLGYLPGDLLDSQVLNSLLTRSLCLFNPTGRIVKALVEVGES